MNIPLLIIGLTQLYISLNSILINFISKKTRFLIREDGYHPILPHNITLLILVAGIFMLLFLKRIKNYRIFIYKLNRYNHIKYSYGDLLKNKEYKELDRYLKLKRFIK